MIDTTLPIAQALPALREALRAGPSAVLEAPPGAGKTTIVPLALLDEPWLAGQRIVLLEPRRLAARAAARRMASLLRQPVGETVGYRIRLESRVGPRTRVEVVTEGILTRFIQDDPGLEGVGLVIFDEFHERSIHADLGLALALHSRAVLRPELRLLAMSATLDGVAVAQLLGAAPVVRSEGRLYPVDTRYLGRRPGAPVEPAVAAAVREALAAEPGDLLVFLPGAGEIRRVDALLADPPLPANVDVYPLHGNLPPELQDRAIQPSRPGRRKVVLATSIAETSLTIEGVRGVIDSGLARVPRFSPRSGMTGLATVRVSRAAAEQRRGRAGRLAAGVCYRLWPAIEQEQLIPHANPEILEADLAPVALELAAAGVTDPAELAWLDPPPAAAYAQARELLAELGALDGGRITPHGRRMARLGLHPRLAHMLLRADELQLGGLACELAALLEERDLLRGERGPPDPDVRLRVELLRERGEPRYVQGYAVDRDAVRRVRLAARQFAARLGRRSADARRVEDVEASGLVLALAYPDRIAQRRPGAGGRYLLRNGLGAALATPLPVGELPYLVAAEVDGRKPESRILRAAPVSLEDVETQLGDQIIREERVEWDATARTVRARRRERLGALVLREAPVRDPDPGLVAQALADAVRREGLDLLPWTEGARRLRQRLQFLHTIDPAWPDVSDAALHAALGDWLAPQLVESERPEDVSRLDVTDLLLSRVGWAQRAGLDELAPTHLMVPSGSRIPIDYADPSAPVLAVRLQELFGLAETPRIARGAVPLTLHLLSPAHRPVQVTRDLAGFWRGSYFDVRKDLRGRYPKHYWPDDPLQAEPTRRAKPRS